MDAAPARVAALETELARLGRERGVEADELARMLVRIAEAERAKIAAEERAGPLVERVRELEAHCEQARRDLDAAREQLRRGGELAEMATRRAGLAEKSASDGAAAVERAGAELAADRARVTDLEARLARTRRDHLAELATLRVAHDEENVRTARALEEERSSSESARRQASTAEAALAATQGAMARAVTLVDEMERREEMTASFRARSLVQTRRILTEPTRTLSSSAPAAVPGSFDTNGLNPSGRNAADTDAPASLGPHLEAKLETIGFDEVDLELPDR
jgi:hypothetical protein